MKIRDEELLARLRALAGRDHVAGSHAASSEPATDDAIELLGLSEHELTPRVRATLRQLIEEMVDLREELATTLSRLAELERLANEDPLAPISNRRAFLRHLGRMIAYVERYHASSSLLYFDLNGLKAINDSFGHAAGDAALIHVAQVLRTHTRTSDVIGRLGGDEFGVLLTHADGGTARHKAAGLAAAVATTELAWEGRAIPVSVAFGAHCLVPGERPEDALVAADREMYAHKRTPGAAMSPAASSAAPSLRR